MHDHAPRRFTQCLCLPRVCASRVSVPPACLCLPRVCASRVSVPPACLCLPHVCASRMSVPPASSSLSERCSERSLPFPSRPVLSDAAGTRLLQGLQDPRLEDWIGRARNRLHRSSIRVADQNPRDDEPSGGWPRDAHVDFALKERRHLHIIVDCGSSSSVSYFECQHVRVVATPHRRMGHYELTL